MKVCMILTNGFEEMEAVGTYALLRRGGLEVDVYSLRGTEAVGRFGLTCAEIKPFAHFQDHSYAALILPGGPQWQELEASHGVQDLLKVFSQSDRLIAAICASPTILGRAGLLQGKNYTCYTAMNEDFGGTFHEDYAVTDGKIITGKSAAATFDFAFAILRALCGEETVQKTKEDIYYQE